MPTAIEMRRGRLRMQILTLGLIGVIVGLASAEVIARAISKRPLKSSRFADDPIRHHRLRPNVSTVERGEIISTNSLGLRDREYSPTPVPGTFRILVLGDSFTEGWGLAADDTVARQLERALNDGRCSGRYEVINAGVGSYSPILEYLLFKDLGRLLHPHLVLLNFDMGDVHDDFIRTRLATLDADRLPIAVPNNPRLEVALLHFPSVKPKAFRFLDPVEHMVNHLALVQTIRRALWVGPNRRYPERLEQAGLIGNVQYDIVAVTRGREFPGLAEAWRDTMRYIVGIQRAAAAQKADFALVTYPWPHQVSAEASPIGRRRFGIGPGLYTSEAPFQILEALGRQQGFPVINLLPDFRRAASNGLLFHDDDIHHTRQGASVFANGLLSGLLKGKRLPCKEPPD